MSERLWWTIEIVNCLASFILGVVLAEIHTRNKQKPL